MRKLNREQKRRIINAKKQNLLPEIERFKRVLEHCTIYMQGIHNHEIYADEICETLKQEGIKFLYETDL